MKKILSVLLCLTLLVGTVFCAFPANAAKAPEPSGYNQKTPLQNADDFSWDNASVYFLLTDRFYNGNTSNDHSYGRATDSNGNPIPGWNTSPGTFHGGDFAGITKKINEGYFDDLGVNAIWLSAPYEQIHGYVTPGEPNDFAHYSYHGYYVLDYTEPDLNFGTKQEFQTMVDTAHKHGIRVIMDIVMNHAGYNTIKDMLEFNFGSFKDKSAAQSYLYKINGVNSLHDTVDYDNGTAEWGRWWGDSWVRSGLPGYHNDGGGDQTMCLSGLPDFRTESSNSVSVPTFLQEKWKKEGTLNSKLSKYGSSNTVTGYISSWLADWVETYGVDGFRCDTAKHVEFASWNKLKTKCVDALKKWRSNNPSKAGANWKDDFWMTGECWGYQLGNSGYYSEGGFDSMINFMFSGSGVPGASSIDGVYQNYASTINKEQGFNSLVYISSHDSNLARNDLAYQGSAFQLMPGGIQIYYGDETNRPLVSGLSFDGNGGSGHSLRSDMNWSSIDQSLLKHWQKVGQFRKKHVCVGAGDHQLISAYNSSTGYTFSRSYDNGEMSDGVIVVIGAPKNTTIAVDVSSMWGENKTVTNYYDGTTAVVRNGKAEFNSGAYGTILIEGPQSTIHMNLKGAYSFYDSEQVTVSLRGADYAMASVNGGQAFRVVDGQSFSIGEGIDLGEVFKVKLTATNATETLEKSFSFKKKDPNAVTTLYFDNSQYNWSEVNAYIYDESSGEAKENAKWPGQAMTLDKNLGLYTLDVDDDLVNGLVIFNAGSGSPNRYPQGDGAKGLEINETNMIFSYGNKWEPYTGQKPQPPTQPDPSKMTTIYFDNSGSGYSTPYVYYWRSSTDSGDVKWPGVAMTKYMGDVWKASFPSENDKCIFSDNGGRQSGNIDIPGTNQIYNGAWSAYEDAEVAPTAAPTQAPTQAPTSPATQKPTSQVITAPVGDKDYILLGDVNGDGTINIMDVTAIQRHLAMLRPLDDKSSAAADCDGDGYVTIKDGTTIQLFIVGSDKQKTKCGSYVEYSGAAPVQPTAAPTQAPTGAPTQVPTQAPTQAPTEAPTQAPTDPVQKLIYFKDNENWGNINAYFWSEENKNMMSWPGVPMDMGSGKIYSVEIPEGATCVIFNGNGRKTGDLNIPGANYIHDNGWQPLTDPKTPSDDPTDSDGYIYYKDNENWGNINAYFWSEENKNMMSWPGTPMETVSDNIYRVKIPEGATCVVFNGNGRQTGDLNIPGSGQIHDNGWAPYTG